MKTQRMLDPFFKSDVIVDDNDVDDTKRRRQCRLSTLSYLLSGFLLDAVRFLERSATFLNVHLSYSANTLNVFLGNFDDELI